MITTKILRERAKELAVEYRRVANGLCTDKDDAFILFLTSAIDVAIILERYCTDNPEEQA